MSSFQRLNSSNIELLPYTSVVPMRAKPTQAPGTPAHGSFAGSSAAGATSALVHTSTGSAPLQTLPYTELNLQTQARFVKETDDYVQNAMRSNKLFGTRSPIVRWTAAGGTIGETLLIAFLVGKVLRREIKANENNTTAKVFAAPTPGQLAFEVGVPVAIWAAFMSVGVGVQYARRSKVKESLQDRWPEFYEVQRKCQVLVASHHRQADEAKNISDSIEQLKGRLGWTPGQDLANVGKGTLAAFVIFLMEVGALLVCAAAAGGGGSDCCFVGGGGGGGGGCCPGGGGSQDAQRRRLQPPDAPENWDDVFGTQRQN